MASPTPDNQPQRHLSLLDATCLIVGIIIGSGVYETTPTIARMAGGPAVLLGLWVVGGLVALVGALCYAELTSAFPRAGSDYLFLRRAYGSPVGFLFGWFDFWIIRPANIGAISVVFARYAQQLDVWSDTASLGMTYAVGGVLLAWLWNLWGSRPAAWVQNLLTISKCLGLAAISVAGIWCFWHRPATIAPPSGDSWSFEGLPLAFVLVMFTYGGWNDVSYLSGEIRDPRRNLLRALMLGVGCVMLIYVCVNLSFLMALGWDGLTHPTTAAAAEVARRAAGAGGARALSALICISCLGAATGMFYTGPRMYFAMSAHHRVFAWLGHWDQRRKSPLRALLVQGAVVVAMLAWALSSNADAFTTLAVFGAPFFWFFLCLSSFSLIRLRKLAPDQDRPFRVPGYPLSPLLFAGCCAFMLYASGSYLISSQLFDDQGKWQGLSGAAWWALGVSIAGAACSLLPHRGETRPN